jgi:sec-independent protein translocase protein TatB
MVNINGPEFLVIALLAMILVGPERLPEYVRGLRTLVLRVRAIVKEGQTTLKDELGEDIDWNQLDPRNYDPRRIVREALFEDDEAEAAATPISGVAAPAAASAPASAHAATVAAGGAVAAEATGVATGSRRSRRGSWSTASLAPVTGVAPFDDEAT